MTETPEGRPVPESGLEQQARDLVNRLRGRYARGPIMANGEPEFGYRIFDRVPAIPDADGSMARPPIYEEAAKTIEALLARHVPRPGTIAEEPAKRVECEKCGGAGWLWGHELDTYYPPDPSYGPDDTRYLCDGEAHTSPDAGATGDNS